MDYFHLSGAPLAVGSIIEPGNWGRIIRAAGWRHNCALREMALECARLARFPHRPSRMDCAFVLPTIADAQNFRQANSGFQFHMLYRVSLCDDEAASHLTDANLCIGHGTLRPDWADVYWMDIAAQAAAIPGIDWTTVTPHIREMLTLSKLRIEERLNP